MITPTPEIILTTREETLDWLFAHNETFDGYSHPVKSLWLCDELNRFESDSGYVYNRPAQDRIAKENSLDDRGERRVSPAPRTRTEGGLLGYLIYMAQLYRDEMNLERDGWTRATQDALAPHVGKIVTAYYNGGLGDEHPAKVKNINGRLRLCPPRSRTKAYAEYLDWWIKK